MDNFLNVVSKAKTACEVSGHEVSDHFADVGKTIAMPKAAEDVKKVERRIALEDKKALKNPNGLDA